MIAKALLTDWIPSRLTSSSGAWERGLGFSFDMRGSHPRCGHYAGRVSGLVELPQAGNLVFSDLVHQARFVARRIAAPFGAAGVEPLGIRRPND
jgi:hypothetical protein